MRVAVLYDYAPLENMSPAISFYQSLSTIAYNIFKQMISVFHYLNVIERQFQKILNNLKYMASLKKIAG